MWVAAVVLYGDAVRVCPLVGGHPCRRGCSGPGYVRRVVWGYHVKPGGEPCLLVGSGGGGGGVVVGRDEVWQGPRSVEGCRAAVPASACYALVTVSDWWYIGLRCVVFGDGPGGMVSLDSAGSMFVLVAGCWVVSILRLTGWAPPVSCCCHWGSRAPSGGAGGAGAGRLCTLCRCPWAPACRALPS